MRRSILSSVFAIGLCVALVLPLATSLADADDGFSDVSSGHPFVTEIGWMVGAGLTQGFPDGTFRPTVAVSRQAAAAFLWRLAGEPVVTSAAGFDDVPVDHPFHDEIAWMVAEGITTGFPDGTFRPTQAVSRQAAAAFLYRYDGESEVSVEAGFDDVPADHPFESEIAWMVGESITTGFPNGGFRPVDDVTRQAMAAFLYRYETGDVAEPTEPATGDWSLVTTPDVRFDEERFGFGQLSSVVAGDSGLVAVGARGPSNDAAAVWTSSDGLDWQRVAHEESIFGGEGAQSMSAVTTGGPGFVAVGADDGYAAVWIASSATEWERVPHDRAVFGGDGLQRMHDVTTGGPGLVAVGTDSTSDGAAAVWTSEDGRTWQRGTPDDQVFAGSSIRMSSVVAGGPGLVAVGSEIGAAVVWTSADGLSWERVPDEQGTLTGDGRGMNAVTSTDDGLVAVGRDGDVTAVWTSTDGVSWNLVPDDGTAFGPQVGFGADAVTWAESVTVGGPGLVAVGLELTPDEIFDPFPAVWTSVNGTEWQRVPHADEVFEYESAMWSVTAGGPGVVAVGSSLGTVSVWVSEPVNERS